jgi:hypothetical protein
MDWKDGPLFKIKFKEPISKRPLELNIGVGAGWPILEIPCVCLRLAALPRLDLGPD